MNRNKNLKECSDELFDLLELSKFIINTDEKKIKQTKDKFYQIVNKILNSKEEGINFERKEIEFIIDFEIYKHIEKIINIQNKRRIDIQK